MIDALSSTERSVNNGTICGVVIWIMRNEKKPIRASVTAAIAANRAAPSDFTKSKKPCTGLVLPAEAPLAPHPARFAQFKVSVRLMPPLPTRKKSVSPLARMEPRRGAPVFGTQSSLIELLAVLLNAGRAQAGEAVLVDR